MSDFIREELTPNVELIGVDTVTPEMLQELMQENPKSLFVIGCDKRMIVEKDTELVGHWVNSLLSTPMNMVEKCVFVLNYDGFNDDPRELYEIPETIAYTKEILKKYPELFYFLEEDTQKWMLLSLNSPKVVEVKGIDKSVEVNVSKLINDILDIHKRMRMINSNRVTKSIEKMLRSYGGL